MHTEQSHTEFLAGQNRTYKLQFQQVRELIREHCKTVSTQYFKPLYYGLRPTSKKSTPNQR